MNTLNFFELDGKDSRYFNVYIRTKTIYDSSEKDVSMQSVPGRSGDLILSNGRIKNKSFSLGLRMFAKEVSSNQNDDFAYNLQRGKNWLLKDESYYIYTDSYNHGYFLYVVQEGAIKVEQKHFDVADLNVTFSAKPYKYRFDGNVPVEFTTVGTIVNTENSFSQPLIRVYTSYSGESPETAVTRFSINNILYSITGISQYVDIDSEQMNTYKGTTPKSKDFTSGNGEYPILNVGTNSIVPVSNCSRIVITPKWRSRM